MNDEGRGMSVEYDPNADLLGMMCSLAPESKIKGILWSATEKAQGSVMTVYVTKSQGSSGASCIARLACALCPLIFIIHSEMTCPLDPQCTQIFPPSPLSPFEL